MWPLESLLYSLLGAPPFLSLSFYLFLRPSISLSLLFSWFQHPFRREGNFTFLEWSELPHRERFWVTDKRRTVRESRERTVEREGLRKVKDKIVAYLVGMNVAFVRKIKSVFICNWIELFRYSLHHFTCVLFPYRYYILNSAYTINLVSRVKGVMRISTWNLEPTTMNPNNSRFGLGVFIPHREALQTSMPRPTPFSNQSVWVRKRNFYA